MLTFYFLLKGMQKFFRIKQKGIPREILFGQIFRSGLNREREEFW